MELSGYVACICEGTAEEVIMEILLEHDKLIFSRSQLIEERPIRCWDAKKFETNICAKDLQTKYRSCAFWIPAEKTSSSARHTNTRWM